MNGREIDCEYSGGSKPTRTEMLEQHLTKLQARVQELESMRAKTPQPASSGGSQRSVTARTSPYRQSDYFHVACLLHIVSSAFTYRPNFDVTVS